MPDKTEELLEAGAAASLAELMALWRARQLELWSRTPKIYRAFAERIIHHGEPLLAYDVIREALNN